MSARQALLFLIQNPFALSRYLDGREYDERVKYATFINKSKKYPYASKRQNREDANENEQS